MNKHDLHSFIADKLPNIRQIAAAKHGKVVYTDTFNGYQPDDNVHIASVTKSILSILIGIAIDQGMIASVDQKVMEFFPEYGIKRGEKTIQQVSLSHLMTMTAPYKFKSEPWTKICTTGDWAIAALDCLGGRAGMTGEMRYTTLGIQILSGILAQASHMSTLDFANTHLFQPLGIAPRTSCFVNNKEEHLEFVTSKSPKGNWWLSDPGGTPAAGFGLCLSAEEMCRIGQLCLNQGVFNNRTIVSADWISQMVTPRVKGGERFHHMQYGYLWWVLDEKGSIYSAIGDSGNVIYVNANENLVVSITSVFKPKVLDRIDFITKYIEPYIMHLEN